MFRRISSVSIIAAVAGVVLAIAMLALVHIASVTEYPSAPTVAPAIPVTPEQQHTFKEYWAAQIDAHGGAVAYATFKTTYNNEPQYHKHEIAHMFGGLLYALEGKKSLAVCDDAYDYGCFHEFIGSAFKAEGVGIIHEMDAFCKTGALDCQHGIGHGLLAVSGYEIEDLHEALTLCHDVGTVDVRDGCYGGIFMEFNMRTMWGDSYRRPRTAMPGHHLCSQVADTAQVACGFWLAQWLLADYLSEHTLIDAVSLAAKDCTTLPPAIAVECYNGLGYEISGYEKAIPIGVSLCQHTIEQDMFAAQCTMSVIAGYYNDVSTRDMAVAACDEQTIIDNEQCRKVLATMQGDRIAPLSYYE